MNSHLPEPIIKESLIGVCFSTFILVIMALYLVKKRGILTKEERATTGGIFALIAVTIFLTATAIRTLAKLVYSLQLLFYILTTSVIGGIGGILMLTVNRKIGAVLVLGASTYYVPFFLSYVWNFGLGSMLMLSIFNACIFIGFNFLILGCVLGFLGK